MYLSVCTRPDIAQAVGALARYMSAPTVAHWAAALGVIRYLAGTGEAGVRDLRGERGDPRGALRRGLRRGRGNEAFYDQIRLPDVRRGSELVEPFAADG